MSATGCVLSNLSVEESNASLYLKLLEVVKDQGDFVPDFSQMLKIPVVV
jgi:hypothetical protein